MSLKFERNKSNKVKVENLMCFVEILKTIRMYFTHILLCQQINLSKFDSLKNQILPY